MLYIEFAMVICLYPSEYPEPISWHEVDLKGHQRLCGTHKGPYGIRHNAKVRSATVSFA
jgi:hypothetical protein